jgi:hypothetical protein
LAGNKTSKAEDVKNKIPKSDIDKRLKEEARDAEKKRLRAHYESLEKVREKQEWYENHAAKMGKSNHSAMLTVMFKQILISSQQLATRELRKEG